MTSVREPHPSQSWRPDVGRLWARLELELRRRDAPWPETGAAALVARGRAGAGVEEWATSVGLPVGLVRRTEAGAVAPSDVPLPLAERCHAAAVPLLRNDPEEPS